MKGQAKGTAIPPPSTLGVPYSWGERSFCKAGRGCHPLSVLYRLIFSFQPKSPCDLPIAMAIFTVLRMY